MRRINKSAPFQNFEDFKREQHPALWDDLTPEVRSSTRKHILENEQHSLCGYTELPIHLEDSHIDHFKRKSPDFFPNLTFNWNNLIVSCCSDDFGARYKDMIYLHKKNKDAYTNIINPVSENPHDYFEYTEWGEIVLKSSLKKEEQIEKATETISAFNLKHSSLQSRRKMVIEYAKAYKAEFTLDQIKEFLKEHGFISVIEQFY
ncbi:MAG: retron system putative HNH endonuclease [Bacteroidota bacterium]